MSVDEHEQKAVDIRKEYERLRELYGEDDARVQDLLQKMQQAAPMTAGGDERIDELDAEVLNPGFGFGGRDQG
jgi:hypothetical protein